MAAAKVAIGRAHTGSFDGDQVQRQAQRAANKTNAHVDSLAVLNNRTYASLTTDVTITAAAYATLLTASIVTMLSQGFLIVTFSVSGTQITANGTGFFQVLLDGVVVKGCYQTVIAGAVFNEAMIVRIPVTKGSHVVTLQWKTNANSMHINAKTVVEEHANMLVQEAA